MERNCYFCKRNISKELVSKFYYCENCQVAIRSEKDMPSVGVGKTIYDIDWVKVQNSSKIKHIKVKKISRLIKKLKGIKTILDIGCGTGILVDMLNKKGFHADGIDSSEDAIRFAQSNKKGNFIFSDVNSFNSSKKYDLIVSTQLIEHLRDPRIFLQCVKKVLKKGGLLLIETPNLNSWRRKSLWRRRIGGMYNCPDHRFSYSHKSLIHLLEENGFSIYRISTHTYSPTIYENLLTTLIYALYPQKEQKILKYKNADINDLSIKYRNSERKSSLSSILFKSLKKIYRFFYVKSKNSFLINIIFYFPNKISQIKMRGNQVVVIARNGFKD